MPHLKQIRRLQPDVLEPRGNDRRVAHAQGRRAWSRGSMSSRERRARQYRRRPRSAAWPGPEAAQRRRLELVDARPALAELAGARQPAHRALDDAALLFVGEMDDAAFAAMAEVRFRAFAHG